MDKSNSDQHESGAANSHRTWAVFLIFIVGSFAYCVTASGDGIGWIGSRGNVGLVFDADGGSFHVGIGGGKPLEYRPYADDYRYVRRSTDIGNGNFFGFGLVCVSRPWTNQGTIERWIYIGIPWWFLIALFAAPAIDRLVHRWHETSRRNRIAQRRRFCGVCGYDLRDTPDRCPECGTIPPPEYVDPASAWEYKLMSDSIPPTLSSSPKPRTPS